MKTSLLLLPFILLFASCKKDSDTTPNSPSNGANSCRITSYEIATGPGGNTTMPVRFDSKGRVTRWGDDSLIYNEGNNTMSLISKSGWIDWIGKLNSSNLFTWVGQNYDFGHNGREFIYSSDGKISKILDSTQYHKYNAFRDWYYWGYKTLNFTYDGNSISKITIAMTDSFPTGDTLVPFKYETKNFTVNYNYNSATMYKINPLMNVMGWVYGNRSNAKIPSSYDVLEGDLPESCYDLIFKTGDVQGAASGLPNRISSLGYTFDKCD